jgi:gluconokinase
LIIVVMGVSGSGKTTIGELLAQRLPCKFADGDDFHSADNKAKMKAGIPLTDDDRQPWLNNLAQLFSAYEKRDESLVLACSALKQSYRQIFLNATSHLVFVYLKSDFETIASRLKHRKHDYMNPDLLKSQFETLEEPEDAITADTRDSPDAIVEKILVEIKADR